VGLAITYALSVTNLLGGVVMFFTETEKQLVSVERAHHYITAIPSEKWDGTLFVRHFPSVLHALCKIGFSSLLIFMAIIATFFYMLYEFYIPFLILHRYETVAVSYFEETCLVD
jgi:hypothetical protein